MEDFQKQSPLPAGYYKHLSLVSGWRGGGEGWRGGGEGWGWGDTTKTTSVLLSFAHPMH